MADDKIALMAHLYRRAGFGATREELEAAAAREYEDVVEDLLHPERFPEVDVDIMGRYFGWDMTSAGAAPWMYRMVNTKRPLQEKMALFWHHVFATAYSKSEHPVTLNRQIDTFRRVGMRDLPTILHGAVQGPGDDLLVGQQREPQGRSRTRTTGASYWSCSRWGLGTTPSRT